MIIMLLICIASIIIISIIVSTHFCELPWGSKDVGGQAARQQSVSSRASDIYHMDF